MRYAAIMILAFLVLFVACEEANKQVVDPITNIASQTTQTAYKTHALTNAFSQQSFRVSDYQTNTLFIHTYATWCESCIEQQRILKNSDFAFIAVAVDPAETREDIVSFAQKNNFSGAYTTADPDFNTELIRAFSADVMKVLEVPVILVCPSGRAQTLPVGINTEEQLRAIARSC